MVNPSNAVEVLYKKSIPAVKLTSAAHGVHNRKHEKKKSDNSANNNRFRSRKPPKNPRELVVSRNSSKLIDAQQTKTIRSHQRKNSPPCTKESPKPKSPEQRYYLPRIKSEKKINHTPRLLSRSKFVLSSKQAGSNSSLVVNISKQKIRSTQQRKISPTALRNDRLKQFFFKSGDTRQTYFLSSTLRDTPIDKGKGSKEKAVQEIRITEKDSKIRTQKHRSKSMDSGRWGASTSVLDYSSDARGRNRDSQMQRNSGDVNKNGRRTGRSADKRRISIKNIEEDDESDLYYESNRCFGDRNPDIYRHVLGPTPDETILAGLQTVIEMCSVAETSLAARPLSSSNLFSTNQDVIDWVESEYSSLEHDQKSTHSQASIENLKQRRRNLQEIERLVKIKSALDGMARDMKTQEEIKSVYTKQPRKDDEKLQYRSASGTSTHYTPSTTSTEKRFDLAEASTTPKVQQPSSTTFGQMSTTWNSSVRSVDREPTYGDIRTPTEFSSGKNTLTETSDPMTMSRTMQRGDSTIYSSKSLQTSLDDYPSTRSTKSLETSTKSIQTSLEPLLSGRSMQTSLYNYPSSLTTTQTVTSTKSAQTSLEPLLSNIAVQTSDYDYPSSKSVVIPGRSFETINKSLQTSLDPQLSNRSMQTSLGLLDLTNRSVQTSYLTTELLPGHVKMESQERSPPRRAESYKSIHTQTSPSLSVSKSSKNLQTSDIEPRYEQCYNCGCNIYQATALYDGTSRTPSYKVINQKPFGDKPYPLESIQEEASSIASSQNPPKQAPSEEQPISHTIVLKEPTQDELRSLSYVISVTDSGTKISKAYIETSEDVKPFEKNVRKSALKRPSGYTSDDEHSLGKNPVNKHSKKSILTDSNQEKPVIKSIIVREPTSEGYRSVSYEVSLAETTITQGHVELPESHESAIKSAMRFPHQTSSLYESEANEVAKAASIVSKSPQKGSAYETLQERSISQPLILDEAHNVYEKSDVRRSKTSQEFIEGNPLQKSQFRDSPFKSPSRSSRRVLSIKELPPDSTKGTPSRETSKSKKLKSVQDLDADRMQKERAYLEEPPARSPPRFTKRMISAPQESNINEIEKERAYLEDANRLEQEMAYFDDMYIEENDIDTATRSSRRMPSGQDMVGDIIPQERAYFEEPSFRSPSRISRRMPQESMETERSYIEEPSFRSPSRISRKMPSVQESNMSRIEKERAYLEEPSFRSPSRISRRMPSAQKSEMDKMERERSYFEERSPSRVSRRTLSPQEPEMERIEKERSYFEEPSYRSPSRYSRRMPSSQEVDADRIEQERAYLEDISFRSPSRASRKMPSTQEISASRVKSERVYYDQPSVRSLPAPSGRMLYVQDPSEERVESEMTLVDDNESASPTRSSRRIVSESPTKSSRRIYSVQDVNPDRAREEEYLSEKSPSRSSRRIISVEEADMNRIDDAIGDTWSKSPSKTSRKLISADRSDTDMVEEDRYIGDIIVKSPVSSRKLIVPQGSHVSRALVRPTGRSSRRLISAQELDVDKEEKGPSRELSLVRRASCIPESDTEKTPEEVLEESAMKLAIRSSRKLQEHDPSRIEKSAVSFKEGPKLVKSSMKSVTIQPGQGASMSQLYASPQDSSMSMQDNSFQESKQSRLAQELSDAKLLEKSHSRKKCSMQEVDREPSREESRRFHKVSAKASSLQPIQETPLSESQTEEIVMDESLGVSTLESITESSQRTSKTSDERQQSQSLMEAVKDESQREIPPAEPYLRRATDESKAGSVPSYPSLKVVGSKTSRHRSLRKDLSRDKVRRKSSHRITRHPNKCSCGNPNCECFKSIQPREIRYATVRITKFDYYSTFEILSSTKKKPRFVPSSIESIFVVKNK
ncbi:hypothetical protein ILUMI_03718 [Ignelater luminosus]|uniref:Uncharacterized protein n=1 Tax=Ignelater luminosus TaxID=2038154 RepID=A0A8K0DA91_IGNLU|nr:hypothetical protein ILUMI_03718 [Ignelater luminosus]